MPLAAVVGDRNVGPNIAWYRHGGHQISIVALKHQPTVAGVELVDHKGIARTAEASYLFTNNGIEVGAAGVNLDPGF